MNICEAMINRILRVNINENKHLFISTMLSSFTVNSSETVFFGLQDAIFPKKFGRERGVCLTVRM